MIYVDNFSYEQLLQINFQHQLLTLINCSPTVNKHLNLMFQQQLSTILQLLTTISYQCLNSNYQFLSTVIDSRFDSKFILHIVTVKNSQQINVASTFLTKTNIL